MLGLIVFLISLGLVLVIVEWFLPSGAFGALGLMALGVAVFFSYQEYGIEIGTLVLVGVVGTSLVGTMLWLKYFPLTPTGKKLMLENQVADPSKSYARFLDKEGTAWSSLRPSGVANIEGQRLDVLSESEHVEPGSRIRVVAVEGHKIVVRKIG